MKKANTKNTNTKRLNSPGNGDDENFVNTRVVVVSYLECQKNVAEETGGNVVVVDGCQEFIASLGEEGTTATRICASCGCHRSFHRRLVTEQ